MKGKIEKYKGFWGDVAYRITYNRGIFASEEANIKTLDIAIEDIDEFMDDVYSQYLKKKQGLLNLIERRAMESVKARKDYLESEKEEAHRQGYIKGWCKGYYKGKEEVITKQEEAEQDKDELEMDNLLIEKYKTYDNIIDKDLEYFEKD